LGYDLQGPLRDWEAIMARVLPVLYGMIIDAVLVGTFVWTTVFVSVP
jgi:hypothetical protein